MSETAIKVSGVSKNFRLPHEKSATIKGAFTKLLKANGSGKRSYETQHALQDISFEIKKGEFFGIVGRNGSGKSTLLKLLAGIYQPTSGTIQTHGKIVPFIELGVGFNAELTGRENVYLNGALLGFSQGEIAEKYEAIVEFAELERFMDQKLKNYSSGMQVRLAFSVATVLAESDILLVDEVLAVGDTDFQLKCYNFFRKLKREGKTVVFVSHDMNAVREYCDRALLIDSSKIISEGKPASVAGEYSKLFIQDTKQDGVHVSKTENRWGDGTAKMLNLKIHASKDGVIRIDVDIKATQTINDPIVGFYFVNEIGQQICGNNTQILGEKLPQFTKSKDYKVSFSITDIFSDGKYSLTLAVLRDSGSTIADWWVDAGDIFVKKAQHIPYLVDVPVKFSCEVK